MGSERSHCNPRGCLVLPGASQKLVSPLLLKRSQSRAECILDECKVENTALHDQTNVSGKAIIERVVDWFLDLFWMELLLSCQRMTFGCCLAGQANQASTETCRRVLQRCTRQPVSNGEASLRHHSRLSCAQAEPTHCQQAGQMISADALECGGTCIYMPHMPRSCRRSSIHCQATVH